jgi:hypothetical protein
MQNTLNAFRMILYENTGLVTASLKWKLPGAASFTDIPSQFFVPFQAPRVFVSRNSQVSFRSRNGTEVCNIQSVRM